MIKLDKVSKKYGNRLILSDVSYQFPRKGIVGLLGKSGSGKTTLLHLLAVLDSDFEGSLKINRTEVKGLNQDEITSFQNHNVAILFQDFNLFNSLSPIENVELPSTISFVVGEETKAKVSSYLFKRLKLSGLENKEVSKLSGGEQQRLALARILTLEPKILLLDEPTGSLDQKSGELIFDLVQQIAKTKLVIIASHDESLLKAHADKIIRIENNQLVEEVNTPNVVSKEGELQLKKQPRKKKEKIPFKTLFQHYQGNKKQNRVRSMISTFVTSIALFAVGSSLLLTDTISKSISNSFAEILPEDSLIMKNKAGFNPHSKMESPELSVLEHFTNSNYREIEAINVVYHSNFENMFRDANIVSLNGKGKTFIFDCYQIRNVSEFLPLQEINHNESFYPYRPVKIDNTGVVLALPYSYMERLCFHLQIERNYFSLGNYITMNGLQIIIELVNYDWNYADEQMLDVVAVIENNQPAFYHSNNLWNEYMFEEQMLFPTSLIRNQVEAKPWTLKKSYAAKVNNDEDFIYKTVTNEYLNQFLFEKIRDHLFLIYYKDEGNLGYFDYLNVLRMSDQITYPIYSTYGFYSIFDANILSGFTFPFYFSNSKERSDYIIDTLSTLDFESGSFRFQDSEQIAEGYYLFQENNIQFKPLDDRLITRGRKPNNLREIVISQELARVLGVSELETKIYNDFVVTETPYKDTVLRELSHAELTVCGFSDSNTLCFYQDPLWLLSYPLLYLKVNPFNLNVHSITFKTDLSVEKNRELVSFLNSAFDKYDFTNPIYEINGSIKNITTSMETILFLFAIVTAVLAIILLTTSTYLSLVELKRELGLFRINGANEKECHKLIIFNCFMRVFTATVFAIVELFVMAFVLNFTVANVFNTTFVFLFNPLSLLVIFFLALLIFLFLSLIILFRFRNLKPLNLLKL